MNKENKWFAPILAVSVILILVLMLYWVIAQRDREHDRWFDTELELILKDYVMYGEGIIDTTDPTVIESFKVMCRELKNEGE